ncbi:hypothetical protein C8Q75DRAFT_781223 [Abortiporus biennis]|nr:hypothetical protein C8Q75DRAFT_781223 [Abortiporus biennis]
MLPEMTFNPHLQVTELKLELVPNPFTARILWRLLLHSASLHTLTRLEIQAPLSEPQRLHEEPAFQGFLYELGNRLQFLDLSHFFDGSTIGDTKDVPLDLSRNTGLLELRVKVFISPKNCRAFNDAINAIVSLKSARFSALYLTIRPIKYSDSEIDVNWSLLDIFLEKQESMKGVNIYLNLDRDDNRGKFTKDKLESILERGLPLTIAKELLFLEEVQLNHLEETEDEGL